MKLKMKYLTVAIFNISFIFSGFICAKSIGDNSPLPDNRPDDLRLNYSVDGGMLYYSESIFISKDSCYYNINDGGAISRVNFNLTNAELDKLYMVFKENNFDEIDSYEQKVYDRGGKNISLSWSAGKQTAVNNSGMTFIKDSWHKEWNACVNAIEKIAKGEMEKQEKNYEIHFDSSLLGKEVHMQINRNIVFPKGILANELSSTGTVVKIVTLSPGFHNASVTVDKKYNTIKINSDSTKILRLYMVNDSLKHELVK